VVGADPGATVLLCAVELCSLHFHYGFDPERMVANALFADGAAAIVGVADTRGAADTRGIADTRGDAQTAGRWSLCASGSWLIPDSEDAMTWNIGDHGFVMTLSPRVPQLIGEHLRPWLARWLAACGLRQDDVGSWA